MIRLRARHNHARAGWSAHLLQALAAILPCNGVQRLRIAVVVQFHSGRNLNREYDPLHGARHGRGQ